MILPEPAFAPVTLGVCVAVQLNVELGVVLVILTSVGVPLHTVVDPITVLTIGKGFTFNVNVVLV